KFKWSRSRRTATIFFARFFNRSWRHDQTGRIGEIRKKRSKSFFEFEFYRVAVKRIDRLNGREIEGKWKRTRIIKGVILTKHAVEIEFNRFCVECRTIMESDVFTQLECVSLAVIRDGPTFGKRRFNFQRSILIAHQPVINIHKNTKIIGGGHRVRIKRLWLRNLAD